MDEIITLKLHSGGALGSDIAWQTIGEEFGMTMFNHYFIKGFGTPHGNREMEIDTELMKQIDADLFKANKSLKRSYPTRNEYVNSLLRRNWFQVKNAKAVFAISTIENNLVNGGTGWAVQMAIDKRIPVFVYCQNFKKWYTYSLGTWSSIETPALVENFAGIGTREITEDGLQAIRSVYQKTLNNGE
jgi:hypothetical protein